MPVRPLRVQLAFPGKLRLMLEELEVLNTVGDRLAHVQISGRRGTAHRDCRVHDACPKIEATVNERDKQMTPDERVRSAASMFETARNWPIVHGYLLRSLI
jgi:hypothetical protein